MDWGKEWLVDFNARKTQLVLFDQSNNTGPNKTLVNALNIYVALAIYFATGKLPAFSMKEEGQNM